MALTRTNSWHHFKGCGRGKKPLEIYMFIDPLCPECWALEPILKKLHIEYGQYFRIRYILSGQLASLNLATKRKQEDLAQQWDKTASRSGMSCDGSLWIENPIDSPYLASFAIKAAELQGKHSGIRFLTLFTRTIISAETRYFRYRSTKGMCPVQPSLIYLNL